MAGLATGDFPQMSNCAHAHTTYDGGMTAMGLYEPSHFQASGIGRICSEAAQQQSYISPAKQDYIDRVINNQPKQEIKVADPKRRLVRVIIIDPDNRVPLDNCILYRGSDHLTDLTDQELFFEIDIKNLLDKHNAARIKLVDKTVKERTEQLEPVKVRDLRMVVVTVATF